MKCIGLWLLAGFLSLVSAAGLEFDKALKELDVPPTENTVSTDFTFTNSSDKPVKITKYDAACSCMSLQVKGGKLLYAPGESGVLRATFEMGNFSGVVDKALQLWLDDDPETKPSVVLTVRVKIPVLVEIEPKTLRWELDAQAEPQTVKITMNYEEPIEVLNVATNNDSFSATLKTVEAGKSYEVEVVPLKTDRPALSIIKVATNCPIERHATQRLFAIVRQPVAEPQADRPKSPIPR